MNAPLRRISMLLVVMFMALMVAGSWIQVVEADDLAADGRNTRSLYRELGRERGPILVSGQSIAESVPSEDFFSYQRNYLAGPLYSAATGYFPVYGSPTAIEAARNDVLNGTADSLFIERIQDLITGQTPAGGSVELTIDPAVQQAAMDGLSGQKGAAIAVDYRTGAILAIVSSPSFDPNALSTHDKTAFDTAYQSLNDDPDKPLVNRAIRGDLYPPGSTFKTVVAAAALESGNYTPQSELAAPDTLPLPGSTSQIHNFGNSSCSSTGTMTLAAGLAISCNTMFGQLAIDLGADAIREQAEKFGFGTDISIPMRATPATFPDDLDAAQVPLAGIGQYDVRVTPLQMLLVASAIANGGRQMQPYLVQTERAANLTVVSEATSEVLATPVSPATANSLSEMMVGVVENGTGKAAQVPGVTIGGKTGTAETTKDRAPHAWFIGFTKDAPKNIAVAIVVENGGSMGGDATGGALAAPIAKKMIEAHLNS